MKRIVFLLSFCCWSMMLVAQRPFEGVFRSEALDVNAELNLYEKNISVPDADDEKCFGYLRGKLNGIWAVLKVIEMDDQKAVVRLASDLGFEAQTIELTATEDGALTVRLVKDNNMKAVKDRKYVKLPKTFELAPMK